MKANPYVFRFPALSETGSDGIPGIVKLFIPSPAGTDSGSAHDESSTGGPDSSLHSIATTQNCCVKCKSANESSDSG